MTYTINIIPNGVAVDRVTEREMRRLNLFVALGSFVIAGCAFWSLALSNFEPESGTPLIFAGLGSLACVVFLFCAMFAGLLIRHLPEQFFFNNDKAVIEIRHKASIAKKIEIPYADILTIDPRTISDWDSSGKRMRMRYTVTLFLKDGTSWDLMDDSILDIDYAFDYAEKIKNNISIQKITTGSVVLPSLDAQKLSILYRGEETQIKWRHNNPASTSRRLGIPLVLIVVSLFMSLMMEGVQWGSMVDTFQKNVRTFSDLSKLPDLLGGLVFTSAIFFVSLIVLLIQIVWIINRRFKTNKLIFTKGQVISEGSNSPISLKDTGTVCFTHHYGKQALSVEILRNVPEHVKSARITLEGDLGFNDVMGMIGKTLKDGLKEAADDIFKPKSDTQQPPNCLAELSFDRFSPVDVYVVKECIRQKLTRSMTMPSPGNQTSVTVL